NPSNSFDITTRNSSARYPQTRRLRAMLGILSGKSRSGARGRVHIANPPSHLGDLSTTTAIVRGTHATSETGFDERRRRPGGPPGRPRMVQDRDGPPRPPSM